MLLQILHLLEERTEHNELGGGRGCGDGARQGDHLRAGGRPGQLILRVFLFHGFRVDTGAHGELAQAHEEHKGLLGRQPVALILQGVHQALARAIQLRLLGAGKLQGFRLEEGHGREARDLVANLVHGAVEHQLADELVEMRLPAEGLVHGDAKKCKEGRGVAEVVDDGRARHRPTEACLDLARTDGQDGLGVAELVSLVAHDAIPDVLQAEEKGRAMDELVVVGDVEGGATRAGLGTGRDVGPCAPPDLSLHLEAGELGLRGCGEPGVHHGKGAQEKGLFLGIVAHRCKDLDSLAEAHVITLKAAEDGTALRGNDGSLGLLHQHPMDAVHLMLVIRHPAPKRQERIGVGRHNGMVNGGFWMAELLDGVATGWVHPQRGHGATSNFSKRNKKKRMCF